jgi:hypothetical protein
MGNSGAFSRQPVMQNNARIRGNKIGAIPHILKNLILN